MKELDYPFDAKQLLRKRKAIKKSLTENNETKLPLRMAVLGGSTTNDVVDMLELFLLNNSIAPVFYQSEYGRFWEDAVFENRELDLFQPEIIYVHTTNRNIDQWPSAGVDKEIADKLAMHQMEKYSIMLDALTEKYHCPIIQNNFEPPAYRLIGNRSVMVPDGRVHFVNQMNILLNDYASSHSNIYINDIAYLAADLGLYHWYDSFAWYMYKYAMSLEAIPFLGFSVSNIVKSIYGKNKKVMALDLDNTLWGGVIGDDGVEGIVVGNETSKGQIYIEFQQYIKELQNRGVLLGVISKNDESNAMEGLNHPAMVLHPDDFVSIHANWEPKSINLEQMAKEINLVPDSFVFVDDNPAEREIVRASILNCGVPEIGEAENYIRILDHCGYFEQSSFSDDDLARNKMYKENAQRNSLRSKYANYEDYLRGLEMKAEISSFESIYVDRIAQLTNKSNQYNLTTRRFSRNEIEQMMLDPTYITLYGKLLDRFGDNGVVSVAIGEKKDNNLEIILWLMSCRVLKRDMEYAMMDSLVECCKGQGIENIIGMYIPTAKNAMVKDFYQLQGFLQIGEQTDGSTKWELKVSDYISKNRVITINQ